jgi:chromosome segregation ATPase
MSPSEYQELTAFFVERLDRYQRETRADSQETRSFVGVTVESLRHEIRIVADGVLGNGRRIDEANRRLDENTRVLEEHGRHLEENNRVLDEHGRRLDENTQRLDEHGRRLDENTRVVDEHGRRLDENTRAVDALTERVGRLEAGV